MNKWVEKLNSVFDEYEGDIEYLHLFSDKVLLEALEEAGYDELVKRYNEINDQEGFWYA